MRLSKIFFPNGGLGPFKKYHQQPKLFLVESFILLSMETSLNHYKNRAGSPQPDNEQWKAENLAVYEQAMIRIAFIPRFGTDVPSVAGKDSLKKRVIMGVCTSLTSRVLPLQCL
eukprot:GFKZ01000976.1.p1 GENE.GFKZ01000976.1~~GFKZ01000976.1.p1  ORF type:complete len:114 (+),score=13.97 GFKZ01000976.1:352-693(+)